MSADHALRVSAQPGPPQRIDQERIELTARAESYARGARADSTWAAYDRQWARFEVWCHAAGERSLPAEPLTVARFLADLAPIWRPATPADPHEDVVAGQVCDRLGLRPGTLQGYLAAISVAHQSAGRPNPTRAGAVRRTMVGIRRHPGVTPVRRRAAARRDPLAAGLPEPSPPRSTSPTLATPHCCSSVGRPPCAATTSPGCR